MLPPFFKLSPPSRRTLTALIPVVCPPEPDPLALIDNLIGRVEFTLGSFPPGIRGILLAGLKIFEYGAAARLSSPVYTFSRLPVAKASLYYESWASSKSALLRQMAMSFKSILLLAYYE